VTLWPSTPPGVSLAELDDKCTAACRAIAGRGVIIDRPALKQLVSKENRRRPQRLHRFQSACRRAGINQNIDPWSDVQCRCVFSDLGINIPNLKNSTLAETGHPVALELAAFRREDRVLREAQSILRAMRGSTLYGHVDPCGTETGRINITLYALSNISRDMRPFIIPLPGYILLSFDFRTMEFVVLGDLSGDRKLREILASGQDLYVWIKEQLLDDEATTVVTARKMAKVLALSITYGRSPWSIAQELDLDFMDASDLVAALQILFPEAEAFLARVAEQAVIDGAVRSLLGRTRHREPGCRKDRWRRKARNHIIQGTAAEVFRERLVALENHLSTTGDGQVLVPMHDGALVQVREDQLEQVLKDVPAILSASPLLSIPLDLKVGYSRTWAEAERTAKIVTRKMEV